MSSRLYGFIKRQYDKLSIDGDWLDGAVSNGWITSDEKAVILGT